MKQWYKKSITNVKKIIPHNISSQVDGGMSDPFMHAQTGARTLMDMRRNLYTKYILPIGPIFLLDISVNIETIWEQQINTIH